MSRSKSLHVFFIKDEASADMNSCKIKLELVKEFLWERGNTVETVCLLSNTQSKKKESYITLDVEMADYYRIKNEGKNSNTGK